MMKRAKLHQSLFAVLFLIIFFSCQNRYDVPLETTIHFSNKVSLEAAKKWVVTMTPQLHAQEGILWELAEETDFGGVPLLTVPVLPADNSEQLLMKKEGSFTKSLVSTQRILFYTDATGSTKSSLIKTENSQNDNLKTYTGNLHFFDPKTNAAQATWQLKNGSFVGSVSFENINKNARSNGCTWELYEVHCGDQCTGVLGGGDQGDYLPNIPQGCCYKYKGCGSGPSEPSNPSPYIPVFNPTSPSIGSGNGGILGGTGGIGGHGTGLLGLFGSTEILDAETGQPSFDVYDIKVVGEESYSEENDYRLYRNPCDGYKYLAEKSKNSTNNREVMGFLTDYGVLMLPNADGQVDVFNINIKIIKSGNTIRLGYPCRINGQLKLVYTLASFHTHPRGFNLSDADIRMARQLNTIKNYVVFNDNGNVSFREFSAPNYPYSLNPPEFLNSQSVQDFMSNRGCQ